MATCANITLEKIRCRVTFGTLVFETPDVKSFSVSKSRTALSTSFSASIEVPVGTVFPLSQDLYIASGTEGNLLRIFTGSVLSITTNPSFEDASSFVVNMSGQDKLHELEGKNISRRQRTRGGAMFAAITNVISRSPQKGTSLEVRKHSGGSQRIANKDTNIREHSKLVRTDPLTWDPYGSAKDPDKRDTATDSLSASVAEVRPKAVQLSPGVSALFQIAGTDYDSGDSWSISDTAIATLTDNQDGTAVVTMRGIGEVIVSYTKGDGTTDFIGAGNITSVAVHDHSDLGAGGPAFGVYSSE